MDLTNGNQGIQQDPMSYKAAKLACQLVESTESFLAIATEIQQSSNATLGENPNDYIKRVIQQYEHVCMIVSVLQSIFCFVSNQQSQNSLSTAATSASTTASTALSRIYSLLLTLKIDDSAARESLSELGLLVQQSRLVNVKVEEIPTTHIVTTQAMDIRAASSSPQAVDYERRELDRKRKQLDKEKEEFERERKRVLLDRDNTIKVQQKLQEQQKLEQQKKNKLRLELQQKLRLEQHQRQEQQEKQRQQQKLQKLQKQKLQQETQRTLDQQRLLKQQQQQEEENELAKQRQQSLLSTDQFLEQFAETAQSFAKSINLDLDNVWESMLLHALPKDKLPWAEENIIGKNYTWRDAKRLYSEKYAENEPSWRPTATFPTAPTNNTIAAASAAGTADIAVTAGAAAPVSMSTVPTAANAVVSDVVNAPTAPVAPFGKALSQISATTASAAPPMERDQRRVADYCQHLLSLEMKFYDTIEEYNKRYMRYCVIANVDVTGKSFIDRYIRSLSPKYREMIRTTISLNQVPLNNINDTMALAENVVNAYLATNPPRNNAPYSQNCVHNRKIKQTV